MKLFFGINNNNNTCCVLSSTIGDGSDAAQMNINNSVVCNVKCNSMNANGAIVMNCVAKSINAKPGSILYNITTTEDVVIEENDVRVGIYYENGDEKVMKSNLDVDGGK